MVEREGFYPSSCDIPISKELYACCWLILGSFQQNPLEKPKRIISVSPSATKPQRLGLPLFKPRGQQERKRTAKYRQLFVDRSFNEANGHPRHTLRTVSVAVETIPPHKKVVELEEIESSTCWVQTSRSSQLSYSPITQNQKGNGSHQKRNHNTAPFVFRFVSIHTASVLFGRCRFQRTIPIGASGGTRN